MTAQKITLTPVEPGAPTYVQAAQGENNARTLEFTIVGADQKPLDLTGCTAAFYVDRGTKGTVQAAVEVKEDNTATVTLPSGACDVPGEWGCWVQVIKPDVFDLRADNLILRVQPCNIDSAAEASDEFTLLTQLITEAQSAITDANEAAETADAAAGDVDEAKETAQKAATAANAAAGAANSAATAANEAAEDANSATSSATSAAESANTAAAAANEAAESVEELVASTPRPNLLLNSDFGINQRGQSTYANHRYTVDRWYNSSAGTVTIAASTLPGGTAKNQMTITHLANSYNTVSQPMENLSEALGKTLTASFWAKAENAGQIRVAFANDVNTTVNVTTTWKKFTIHLAPTAANSAWTVNGLCFQSASNGADSNALGSLTIAEPQLVYGSCAGQYVPPEPVTELMKCQRFYYKTKGNSIYGFTQASNSTTKIVYPSFILPGGLRATPKVTMPENGIMIRGNGKTVYAEEINAVYRRDNEVGMEVTAEAIGDNEAISGRFDTSNHTEFDAEIYS